MSRTSRGHKRITGDGVRSGLVAHYRGSLYVSDTYRKLVTRRRDRRRGKLELRKN